MCILFNRCIYRYYGALSFSIASLIQKKESERLGVLYLLTSVGGNDGDGDHANKRFIIEAFYRNRAIKIKSSALGR